MKKQIVCILTMILILALAACGSQKPSIQDNPVSAESLAPTSEDVAAAEEPAAQIPTASDDLYAALELEAASEVESVLTQLETKWSALSAKVTDYGSYIANEEEIEGFYTKIYISSATLCVKMREFAIRYAEEVLASGKSAEEMYDDLEPLCDLIYEDMGDEIYNGIYDGVLEAMNDGLYKDALDDAPDDASYADWLDTRSEAYEMWLDVRGETYEQWLDYRSDVYDFWLDVRSEVFSNDLARAQEKIADFTEDSQEMGDALAAWMESTNTEALPPEENSAADQPAADGIRPEFKDAMDRYEAFFDEYVDFMKSYTEDPAAMVGEYASMMQQYIETMSALEAIDDGTLSEEETRYYAEVTLRISQKLLEVA